MGDSTMGGAATVRDAVMITGASTGIGKATALYLAAKGLRVLAGVRKPADGDALVAAFAAGEHGVPSTVSGGGVEPLIIDVANGDSIARATAELGERLGGSPLRGLVNNAGIAVGGPQEYIALSEWRRQFEVNVFGLVDVTQRVLPHLLASRGRVVNISSVGGKVATPLMGPYCASKFALEGLSDSLRLELAAFGVWVACVEPGAVKTEIWKKGDAMVAQQKDDLPAEAQRKYGRLIAAFERFSARSAKKGVESIAVARAVEHALLARRPRTRYPVGPDARAGVFLKWLLPDRVFEWMLMKVG
jgi:NAD(P)-dependent dehydrogenase (short-subunit alcohol dehydrogenase family)